MLYLKFRENIGPHIKLHTMLNFKSRNLQRVSNRTAPFHCLRLTVIMATQPTPIAQCTHRKVCIELLHNLFLEASDGKIKINTEAKLHTRVLRQLEHGHHVGHLCKHSTKGVPNVIPKFPRLFTGAPWWPDNNGGSNRRECSDLN